MTSFQARMAELEARFCSRLAEEYAGFSLSLSQDDREGLSNRAHRLAGIAGMLGAGDVGKAALELEEAVLAGGGFADEAERLMALIGKRMDG